MSILTQTIGCRLRRYRQERGYSQEALAELAGCEVHSSVILSQVDSDVFKKLGVNLTCEPVYQTKKLYHK